MARPDELDFEGVLEELKLPLDPVDLFEQLSHWKGIDHVDERLLELSDPCFLEGAVAILLHLLKRKRGLDMDRLLLMVRLIELTPGELFAAGAMGRAASA